MVAAPSRSSCLRESPGKSTSCRPVTVQRKARAGLGECLSSKPQPRRGPRGFGSSTGTISSPEPGQLPLEARPLTFRTADHDAVNTRCRQECNLVGRDRPPRNRHERLGRPSAASRSRSAFLLRQGSPHDSGLGFARFLGLGWARKERGGPADRLVHEAGGPDVPGSSMFRPSTMSGVRMASRTAPAGRSCSSGHSVTISAASAPGPPPARFRQLDACQQVRASSSATGSQTRTMRPRRGAGRRGRGSAPRACRSCSA